eukprot:3338936-Rhodomonas_salina.1
MERESVDPLRGSRQRWVFRLRAEQCCRVPRVGGVEVEVERGGGQCGGHVGRGPGVRCSDGTRGWGRNEFFLRCRGWVVSTGHGVGNA